MRHGGCYVAGMMRTRRVVVGAALGLLGASSLYFALERSAAACGGCFAPPENNTVVTDHRMVLTVSPQQTTLYDQIRYQGSPESFAWVLPIKGEAIVGVSSDTVFGVLDSLTSVQVIAPPRNCPPPIAQCNAPRSNAGATATGAEDGNGVSVLRQETVGPYETVQLRATDPQALNRWLTEKGYRLSPEVAPVVAAYVNESFDFLALKLVPGKSVTAMKPVRVTTNGASPVLPLRMVAAGTGASVGISLWVVGDGRWEPQNFRSFVVKPEDLSWSWAQNASDFKAVRAKKNGDLGGSAWEIESSLTQTSVNLTAQILAQANFDPRTGQPTLASEYPPVKDDQGKIVRTSEQVAQEDMGFLVGSPRSVRVTRMRADLPQASLAADLALQASADQSDLSRQRNVTRESDQPLCPIYDSNCDVIGQAPRDQILGSVGNGGGGCAASGNTKGDLLGGVLGLALVGLVCARARRRR